MRPTAAFQTHIITSSDDCSLQCINNLGGNDQIRFRQNLYTKSIHILYGLSFWGKIRITQ